MKELDFKAMIYGMMQIEQFNDQFRQPNRNGRFPICRPSVGISPPVCDRCGVEINQDDRAPCSAIPKNQRWGEDYVPKT